MWPFSRKAQKSKPTPPVGRPAKQGYIANIESETEKNEDYRRVLYTGAKMQLVLMTLRPGEEIGLETHAEGDQFIRFEKGRGEVWIDGVVTQIKADDAVFIPAGAEHNVLNTGRGPLKLYSLYGPPEHRHGLVHTSKADAADEQHFDGAVSE